MPFSNVWDETAPADTSLASLYALAVRNMKLDIHERMRNTVGTVANRLNPESVFGTAGEGVGFYATDQDILYQWTGAAWSNVRDFGSSGQANSSSGTRYTDITNPTVTNPGAPTNINSITVPANAYNVPGSFFIINGVVKSISGTWSLTLQIGGQNVSVGVGGIGGPTLVSFSYSAFFNAANQAYQIGNIIAAPAGSFTGPANSAGSLTIATVVASGTLSVQGLGLFVLMFK